MTTMSKLVGLLKQREIGKVCYFHTDHFEPWSKGVNSDSVRGVEAFARQSRKSRFCQKANLFYHAYFPYRLDKSVVSNSGMGTESIRLGERSKHVNQICSEAMTPLNHDSQYEFHIHIHHEKWTRNKSDFGEVSRWVNAHSTAEEDSQRLDDAIPRIKAIVENDIGESLDQWAFVHGNWALNASDPTICCIEDEIALLMKHGCFGDFTFPAGRRRCEPTILLEPYTCLPTTGVKAYDSEESSPIVVGPGTSAFDEGRFFIWNSRLKADFSSLDYYSERNRKCFSDAETFVHSWLEKAVVIDRVLYIKTHAHSLKWEYRIGRSQNPIPHLYPPVLRIFDVLEKACELSQIELEVCTVNQIMKTLRGLPAEEVPVSTKIKAPALCVRPQLAINRIRDCIGEAMISLCETMERADEADDKFYRARIDRRQWLAEYELSVIDYLLENHNPDTTCVTEVGCGWGTLSLALGALGYHVNAVEGNKLRFSGAVYLRDYVAKGLLSSLERYDILKGFYPDMQNSFLIDPNKENILVLTNLVNSFTANNTESIIDAASAFDRLLIDVERFGVKRVSADSIDHLGSLLDQHFEICEPPRLDGGTMREYVSKG